VKTLERPSPKEPPPNIWVRTIDITTIGRRTGEPRRIEICVYYFEGATYLSGIPTERTRDGLFNLKSDPHFIFHLKHGVIEDLSAVAAVMTDETEHRQTLSEFVDDFNRRRTPDDQWPVAHLDEWVAHSPLARITFP
jgi:hypothetical protein